MANNKAKKAKKVNKINLFEQKKRIDSGESTKSNKLNKSNKSGKINKTKYQSHYKTSLPGMTGKVKVFDKNLSNKYDVKARQIIRDLLGKGVMDNPKTYGEDILVLTDQIPYGYIELQVYGKWTDDKFPKPMPYIYERKMKFNPNTLFICFNASFEKAIIFSKSCINEKKHRPKKYSREFIHYVPWHKTMTIDVSKLSYDKILSYCDPERYFELLELREEMRLEGKTLVENNTNNLQDLIDIIG